MPVHAGEEAFAALEQSIVCEVEPLSRNWAFAAIVPAHNSATTKERNLRGIRGDSSVNGGLAQIIRMVVKAGVYR